MRGGEVVDIWQIPKARKNSGMHKTHKEMIVESDDHTVMDLEIIDGAGNITEIKARAVNIKYKSGLR